MTFYISKKLKPIPVKNSFKAVATNASAFVSQKVPPPVPPRPVSVTPYSRPWSVMDSIKNFRLPMKRLANSVVGKVGLVASEEEVIIQLILSKCMLMLMYGLVTCVLNKSDIKLLDFVINSCFVKLFKANNMEIINT